MSVAENLVQPSRYSGSDRSTERRQKINRDSDYQYVRNTIAVVALLVCATCVITLNYYAEGYLLEESITGFAVVGMLLTIKLLGKPDETKVPGTLTKK